MPRPLAGFFIPGEGDVGLNLAKDIADGRGFEFLTNVSMPVDGAQYLAVQPDTRAMLQQTGCWDALWQHATLPLSDDQEKNLPFHADSKMIGLNEG